jgi:hypothetical protein
MSHEINTQILEHFYQDLSYQLEDNDFSKNELFNLLEMLERTEKGDFIMQDMIKSKPGLLPRLTDLHTCLLMTNRSFQKTKNEYEK